jgi:hypothetical protein
MNIGGGAREGLLTIVSLAAFVGVVGCSSSLTSPDSGMRAMQSGGSGGGGIFGTGGIGTGGELGTGGVSTGGTTGIDASVDAVAGLACPALAEPTGSPAPLPPQPGCPCTRALGRGNSYQCPMGVGQTNYATIGPAGGSLILPGQQSKASGVSFAITIPPGALASDTLISVEETDLGPPSGLVDWSPVYLLEPRGLQLARVAGLQIPWSSNVSQTPNTLGVYARDENGACGFKRLVDSYTNAGFEQASLTELGYLLVATPSSVDPSTCGADASIGN